jgi:ubiquitin carboxyl-terminal hydrolase 10
VVGFSIPAAGAGSGAAESVKKNHAALRALLSAPAADATAAAPKSFADASASAASTASEKTREERLTPRGLVNTGNMCFANAVLQVLVYCALFSSLFARLHALLGEAEFDVAGTGAGGFNTNPSGGQDDGGGGGGVLGPAPLVRATGAFLREFIVSVSAKKPVNGGAGGKGKGKVSPAEEQEEEPEAFIPTHIYDALKGKKRFDGMRVRILRLSLFSCVLM